MSIHPIYSVVVVYVSFVARGKVKIPFSSKKRMRNDQFYFSHSSFE